MIAVTRPVSPTLAACELTHLVREPIDVARAVAQHAGYEALLRTRGVTVVQAPGAPEFPDAVFIEDTAIILDEIAILTRPGALARRGELDGVAPLLSHYRALARIEAPATLDGGDVMRIGRSLYVGRSGRTNAEGIEQLARLAQPHGYTVTPLEFTGCLHLKSAVTPLTDNLLLLNPAWVARSAFAGIDTIAVDTTEPHAANVLQLGAEVIASAQYPRTLDRLDGRGLHVFTVDCSELAKAEGAVTCCSLVIP